MSKLLNALQRVEGTKIPLRELQYKSYTAKNVAPAETRNTNYAGQLLGIAQDATQLYSTHVQRSEERGQKLKNEIMLQNLAPEELKKMRESGVLLYQDDPYAMRALEKSLGRQEAYNVEAMIRERISNGDYKNRQEMEEDRARLMGDSYKNMSVAYGMPEGGTRYFQEGYSSDMVERNMAIYDAQARKQDQMMRNESMVAIRNGVSGLVKSGYSDTAFEWLEHQRSQGLIRNDAEMEKHLVSALKDAVQIPNNMVNIHNMMDRNINLHGQETTLRQLYGEEYFRSMENAQAQATLNNNWDSQQWLLQRTHTLGNFDYDQPDADVKGLDMIRELEGWADQTQGTEVSTQARLQVEQAKVAYFEGLRKHNEKLTNSIMSQQKSYVRVVELDSRIEGRLRGDTSLSLDLTSFQETPQSGAYEVNDWNNYYSWKMEQINADENLSQDAKAAKVMRLGSLLKSEAKAGFGAHFQQNVKMANDDLTKYARSLEMGTEPPKTPNLDSLINMYKVDPELFVAVYGDTGSIATEVSIAGNLGVHPATLARGRMLLNNMPREQQQQMSLEIQNLLTSQGSSAFQYLRQTEQDAIRSVYVAMDGMTNSERVTEIKNHLDKQYTIFDSGSFYKSNNIRGAIPKDALMLDPQNPKSAEQGAAYLKNYVASQFGDNTVATVSYTDNGTFLIKTPLGVRMLTKEQLVALNNAK